MALSILYQRTPTTFDSITLDALISQSPQYSSEVTEHPVEKGADITDHVRPKSLNLSIEGMISETPIENIQSRILQAKAAIDNFALGKLSPSPPTDPRGPVRIAYEQLLAIRAEGKVISIVSRLAKYENLVLQELKFVVDASTGDSLLFQASLKEIVTVESSVSPVVTNKNAAKTKKALGQKPPVREATTPEKDQSLAVKLFNSLFGSK